VNGVAALLTGAVLTDLSNIAVGGINAVIIPHVGTLFFHLENHFTNINALSTSSAAHDQTASTQTVCIQLKLHVAQHGSIEVSELLVSSTAAKRYFFY